MAVQKRPRRQPDVALREDAPHSNSPLTPASYLALRVPSSSAIVIDLGSSTLRAGFSNELDAAPRLNFPPYIARGREVDRDGTVRSQIGYEALSTSYRSSARTPFDGGVPSNCMLSERLLDGVLSKLGLADCESIEHPLVLTEPPGQPNGVRAQFTELMFEAYRIPRLCLGIDALFSHLYNNHTRDIDSGAHYARKQGVVISCGYSATHVLPVHDASFYAPAAKRINVGGHDMTNSLSRRLQLLHPEQSSVISYAKAEALKHDVCYVSKDYMDETKQLCNDSDTFESVFKLVKLPSEETGPSKPELSPEEQERVLKLRKERGKRLSEMMKERNRAKALANGGDSAKKAASAAAAIRVPEEESRALRSALQRLRNLERVKAVREEDENIYLLARVKESIDSEEALEEELLAREKQVKKETEALGEDKANVVKAVFLQKAQEDELILVPDSELTATGLKRKRHLRSLRGAAETRLRIKREKEEALRKQKEEAERLTKLREADPEKYLSDLRKQRQEVAEKIRRRTAMKTAGSKRRSQASRQRMRLLAQHAGNQGAVEEPKKGSANSGTAGRKKDKGSEDDTFGMNDSDWDVYRDMKVRETGDDDSDNESVADKEMLKQLRAKILEISPDDDDPTMIRPVGSALLYVPHPIADEIPVVLDRLRTPEIMFQPSLIGVEQCGLGEAIEMCVRTFDSPAARRDLLGDVFLTGGGALFPGLEARVRVDLRMKFPSDWGEDVARNVRRAKDPVLDAWRGGCLFAEAGGSQFKKACITKQDYEEKGPDYIVDHPLGNWHVPTPYVDPVEAERKKKLLSYKRY